jgi:ribosome-associated translation inhibitor RaiA
VLRSSVGARVIVDRRKRMGSSGNGRTPASLEQLRLGAGFQEGEREEVVARLSRLNRRLKRFDADATELVVSVKGRDSAEQQVTLEARLPGHERFVAVSQEPRLKDALNDVRDDIWRQIDDAVNKRQDRRRRP